MTRPRAGSGLLLVATILGSGAVFLEGSVTAVALPAMAKDLGLGLAGLQWVMNGYLLTLSALMLLGGSLGDRYSRRRVFGIGLAAFAVASLGCALAPSVEILVCARLVQGAAGALVVPNSLALLETTFHGEERGAAIGKWSAWSAVSSALGPLIGGTLVDLTSWRVVFVAVAPFALVAAWMANRAGATGSRDAEPTRTAIDYRGAVLATIGLAGIITAMIAAPHSGYASGGVIAAFSIGIAALIGFVIAEHRAKEPLLPPGIFKSRQFLGVNVTTLLVYAALNGLFFLLMLQLQTNVGYSALTAGSCLLPINALMLAVSPVAGRVAQRIGPRTPMVVGALIAAAGMLLFGRVRPGGTFVTTVLPATLVFGFGLACFVAPLTSVALDALGEKLAGLASGVNNAVARLAGLFATAVIPVAAGLGGSASLKGATLTTGFTHAMYISAGLCVAGAVVAAVTIGGETAASPRASGK
ncbi:MAG: MFS transporter [bacterium]